MLEGRQALSIWVNFIAEDKSTVAIILAPFPEAILLSNNYLYPACIMFTPYGQVTYVSCKSQVSTFKDFRI